ncbi:folate-sensitive fragile site protein Fra10Ac1-domain-containing protein [Mycena metata]|uniref:Folate-sensitive fragile site protein Fra10Ac1-domain-containing protein n=1 Tax=Mycena metata TaxID=1033252 RepID=A0AAD7N443_9AGAR|nr:folate-sensitive fragile site protein Fra10Ac1-domain-containing protein [Mycena metata]
MALYPHPSSSKLPTPGKTEFEILKDSHKFLREEDNKGQPLSWDEQLASKYYDSLFREYAVCDLKHYKSGNFSLRWRTEAEVLSGAGETTCGNTRCEHHDLRGRRPPPLTTLELPFAYTEHREEKSALVKAVLCEKCLGKLMWKRRKEKERLLAEASEATNVEKPDLQQNDRQESRNRRRELPDEADSEDPPRHRERHSRSSSPKPRQQPRRRSPIR